jgi:hypothetical protein
MKLRKKKGQKTIAKDIQISFFSRLFFCVLFYSIERDNNNTLNTLNTLMISDDKWENSLDSFFMVCCVWKNQDQLRSRFDYLYIHISHAIFMCVKGKFNEKYLKYLENVLLHERKEEGFCYSSAWCHQCEIFFFIGEKIFTSSLRILCFFTKMYHCQIDSDIFLKAHL